MTTIEQVRIVEAGKISLDRVELAPCGPRDAIVEVAACGICGSDLSYIRLGGLAGPSGEPMALGHELAGTVTTVGAEVTDIVVGQRVVVHPGADDIGRIGRPLERRFVEGVGRLVEIHSHQRRQAAAERVAGETDFPGVGCAHIQIESRGIDDLLCKG